MRLCRRLALFASFAFLLISENVAADPVGTASARLGPHQVVSAEYKFDAAIDNEVLTEKETEVWARVFWPESSKGEKRPILFFLHGNHQTCGTDTSPRVDTDCSYTSDGTCPSGNIVVPNHEGYNYLAEHLASYGYIVVSINANRGITCGYGDSDDYGLILARGRLVLRHMAKWSQWNTTGGAPKELTPDPSAFIGAIDFGQIGLFGHSRGGEGMRAAYNLLNDADSPWSSQIPGAKVRAIFEIGATDGMSSRQLDAFNTAWNQLLPMCDGDVSDFSGRYPFERMLRAGGEKEATPKSLYMVWGANHNFFNSEWLANDSFSCHNHEALFKPDDIESGRQRGVALLAVSDFFRAHVGVSKEPLLARHFNPSYPLPAPVLRLTQVDRDMTSSIDDLLSLKLEDFSQATGKNASGELNLAGAIEIEHQKPSDATSFRAWVRWQKEDPNAFFQMNWTPRGSARSILDRETLDFRVARLEDILNDREQTDFSVQLVHSDDSLSAPVRVLDFGSIRGPVSTMTLYQTVRIPLQAFKDARLEDIRGVRLEFNQSRSGALLLADFRFSSVLNMDGGSPANLRRAENGAENVPNSKSWKLNRMQTSAPRQPRVRQASVLTQRMTEAALQLAGKPGIEIEFTTKDRFPVRDDLPVLVIGNRRFIASRFPESGRTDQLIFSIPRAEYSRLENGSEMRIEYGRKTDLIYALPPFKKAH